ncbi:hypothetical protein AAZX31_03G136400 [Glycine max]|uniref:Uncharacterized protein n=2 Tax=Glycine subgen. Soja TaxID=1462606 RepID=K7KF92_SOYBN|nr:hypothetical protein JHK87_007420 [Glycine soja]KAG5055293.1 hypothetical protein JHK85_007803 [Glycine max]KAG5072367.1 hypothetical protein JHK86_007578 [Glycine max]KAH1070173.1 hypothetical protein GYH30_007332 [Glycine max]KAH1258306.1 hypothetical protein GmHk_03G008063 [Glycine max]
MAATRSQLCMFFVLVAITFTPSAVFGQKTATCVFIKANCGTNHDCFAPCKLKLKNDYCPGYAICDNGSSCCCQRIPNCGSPPLRKT